MTIIKHIPFESVGWSPALCWWLRPKVERDAKVYLVKQMGTRLLLPRTMV